MRQNCVTRWSLAVPRLRLELLVQPSKDGGNIALANPLHSSWHQKAKQVHVRGMQIPLCYYIYYTSI